MKSVLLRVILGMLLIGGIPMSALRAADEVKTLPTLLIKGEVVSLDASDPAATLLKVKDRYGFETPIYLTTETKISSGESTILAANLAAGTGVEVEYNFDVNTAKRHAVSVKVAVASAPTPVASAPASIPAVAPPVASVPAVEAPTSKPAPAPSTAAAAPHEQAAPQVQ